MSSRAHVYRSTKAGVRTPATLRMRPRAPALHTITIAQRRPGFEPRRHSGRSPDARTHTTALNEGRGSNPGDTGSGSRPSCRRAATLNEGRGSNPGDTYRCSRLDATPRSSSRSTKAGVRTPATRGVKATGDPAWSWRSTKAEVRTPATRPYSGRPPGLRHRHQRSTKAGVRTPATHEVSRSRSALRVDWRAQRRPGFEPRRHPSTTSASW